ncbi:MAG: glycerate kinase [bacterium]|nr:MAG: glycerate kinase [bacterium]
MNLRENAIQILNSAIDAIKPDRLIKHKLRFEKGLLKIEDKQFDLDKYDRIYIIGAGKASAVMARELENLLGDRIFYGVISVKYGHGVACRKMRILEAGHPVLDENGIQATSQILQIAEDAGENDLVFCLLSGGGSALLEKPPPGISLMDLQRMFELLLSCGANIEEVNAVRKHLSLVKGGQLARTIYPATCVSLILSDVIGDPLESIASGPTAPDPATFQDAWQIIEKYKLSDAVPESIREYLVKGLQSKIPDTLKTGDEVFRKVNHFILGNNLGALKTAEDVAQELGYNTLVISSRIQGEAREIARVAAAIAQEIAQRDMPVKKPACILMGGETTVTLRGKGKGGRNQELALAALLAMSGEKHQYLIASCGTDGTDGPTDAAGGMIDPGIWTKANNMGMSPLKFLENNDAYTFLSQTGGLIMTGPTGTNVMDIIMMLIK